MSMFGPAAMPPNASVPSGTELVTYDAYDRARKTVDYLVAQDFDIKHVSIIGKDLLVVERITGKLSLPRAAFSGAMGGAWFGLFIGLIMSLMGGEAAETFTIPASIALGAGFGIVFSVVAFSLSNRRKSGYVTAKTIVAQTYAVICDPASSARARELLSRMHLDT